MAEPSDREEDETSSGAAAFWLVCCARCALFLPALDLLKEPPFCFCLWPPFGWLPRWPCCFAPCRGEQATAAPPMRAIAVPLTTSGTSTGMTSSDCANVSSAKAKTILPERGPESGARMIVAEAPERRRTLPFSYCKSYVWYLRIDALAPYAHICSQVSS